MGSRKAQAVAIVLALAFGACESGGPTEVDQDLGWLASVAALQQVATQCTTVTFDSFEHGDAVTAINVLGVPLTLSAVRYLSGSSVDPTAYDVELTGAALAALNASHDDTQAERDCADCAGHGRILVVPDVDFATKGDNTDGGEILFSGFAADPDPTSVWEITNFDVVDGDSNQGYTRLYVDGFLKGISTRTGNATIETVSASANTISGEVNFIIGEHNPTSGGIDNVRLCRTTTTEEGGGEGCTPGYWRQPQHYDSWVGYDPTDSYLDVFSVGPDEELGETIQANGGGERAFLRHSTAALLNSTSNVSFDMSTAEVIQLVQDTYAAVAATPKEKDQKDIFTAAKDTFAGFNEQYCPLS